MKTVVTIGGSSSRNSINRQLAEYTGNKLEGVALIQVDLSKFDLPLFSIDKEREEGFPERVMDLNAIVEKADGFVISLAEHNGAYSAAFKNAFDWLSRIDGKVWREKPVLLMSAAPGGRGGKSVLEIALNRFPRNGAVISGSLSFPNFAANFVQGKVVDEALETAIKELVGTFEKSL
jgi:NAD(P)H-dependent FMN reductase